MSSWLTTSPLAHRAAFAARDYVCTEKEGGAQQQSDGVRFCVVGKRITLPQVMEKSTFESRAFLFSPSQQGGKGVFITFFSFSLELIYKTFQYFIVPADVAIRVCWTVNLGVHLSTVQWPLHAIAQENEKAILLLYRISLNAPGVDPGCLLLLFLCLGDFSSQLVGSFTSSPIERKSFVGNN